MKNKNLKICLQNLWLPLMLLISLSLQAQDTLITKYPNTNQRWEKIFIEDKKVAENIYHSNGTPWMTVKFDEPTEQEWKWYHSNGNPFFEAMIIDDLLQGTYKIWYENGQLAEQICFEDNIEQGDAIYFHPNGQIAMQGSYQDGKMVGDWEFYNEDGSIPEGAWEWRFAALPEFTRIKGQFRNGQPSGRWTYQATANHGRQSQKKFEKDFEQSKNRVW